MIFTHMSLHCMLVPVQCRKYEYGNYYYLIIKTWEDCIIKST